MTDNKKYIINIGDHSEEWTPDMYAEAADRLFADHQDANVFELEDVEDFDEDPSDHQYVINIGDHGEVWDGDMVREAGASLKEEHPDVKIQRVSYKDYWGEQATANREQRALLAQPDQERNAKLADLGYYDDITGEAFSYTQSEEGVPQWGPSLGLQPLSSIVGENEDGTTSYADPKVAEFFASDTSYNDRMAEIARLDAEYESNPAVIAQREWEAEWRAEHAKYAENLENQIRKDAKDAGHGNLERMQMRKAAPMLGMGHPLAVAQYNAMYADADLPDSEANNFAAALNMLELAKQARTVKDKKAWQALTDEAQRKFMAEILQPAGANYVKIGNILTRIEKEYGAVDEESLTPEKLDELLTKDEQALILSFMEYNAALADAQVDASTAYKGAQQFAKSVPFMLEMMMTGGLYNAAGKAATSKMTRSLMEWAAKKGAGKALRKFAAKSAIRLTYGATGTLARTVATPSTYKAMAEGAASSMDDEGHMHKFKGAVVAGLDKYIENFSEITGDAFGIAGKSIAKSLGKIDFGKVGKFLADSNFMQKAGRFLTNTNDLLKQFGFHGFAGEIGEELIGAAIREVTFVQPGAMKEMFEGDNFGAMLIGFAPMSLFGAGMSAVSMGAMSIEAANLGKKLRETLSYHYKPEQIDHMMNLVSKAKNGDQVMQAISPLMDGLTKEEGQQLLQYGAFMAQNKAMLFAKKAQEDNLAQAKRAELQQTYNKFWQQNAEGAESVQIAELRDGQTVFVTSAPNENGMVAIIDAKTGKQGFTNVSEYAEQTDQEGNTTPATRTWSMDAFLESRIAAERLTAQEARMTREYNEQVQNLQSQITRGTKINLGTTGNPIWMVANGNFSKDGVFAIDSTGATHTIGWNQVADAMNQPIRLKTDQEIIDEEVAAVVARNAERRKKMSNATPAMTDAVNESAAQSAEVVAQENKHIPMNEDGTVNEAAFWEQDPEGYAAWNDEQNQDGGADTREQIAISKAMLTQMLGEAVAAQQTSNPVVRKQAKKNAEDIQAQIDKLTALEAKYEEQRIAPFRERAMKWIGLTNAPVHIIETEEELAKISSDAENASGRGARVRGMAKDGKAYIYLPGIVDASEIDAVFMHEAVAHTGLKGMLGQQAFDELCDQVWEMMSPEARQVFIGYPGVNGNKRAAADEYIAHVAERMGAGVATAEEKTIWQKIVDFVRNVLRAMGVDINLSESELADLLQMAYKDLAKNMAEAEKIAKQNAAATEARRNAPTAAKEKYDEYLTKGLTAEEIKAGAQNEFDNALKEYNDLQAQAPKVEMGESVEDFIARKKAYNDKLEKAKTLLDEKQTMMDEIARREKPADGAQAPEVVEDLEQTQQTDGSFRLSMVTYNDWTDNLGNTHKGTRTQVIERMIAMNFSDAERNEMLAKMDTAYEYMEKLRSLTNEDGSVRFDEFNAWAEKTPLYKQVGRDYVKAITSLVSNGDYPINMELTTDCIKREAFTMLLNTLVKRGADLSKMGPGEIVTIQKMMNQYGIEVACKLCFVEGKRLQIVNWASQIVEDWNNALVEAGVTTDEYFEFGKDGDAFIPAEEWRTHENKAEVAKMWRQLDEIGLLFQGIDPKQFKRQRAKNKKAVEKYKKEKAEAWAKKTKKPIEEWKPTDKQAAEIKKMSQEGLAPTYVNENMEEYRNAFNAMRNEWLEKHPGKDPLSFTPTKKQWEALGKIRNRQIDTVRAKMVRLIMEYPEMRKKMTLNDLLGSKGLMEIRQQHGQAYADLYSIILQRFGTGTPKPVQDAVPYDGELMTLSETAFKKANEIGGARLFSFSDFDITKVFDYMQMFFDLEANRQMLQSYTKEVAAVIIFGRSNAKFNISTLANAYVPQEVLDEYAKASEGKQKEMRHKWAENAGLLVDEAGNITDINFSEEHSVSPAFAQQIFHDEARNKDCGAIMVGASVNHAIYSAAQAWIRMVIPFHLSGMPKAAQDKTDVKWYFDNTPFQSTRKKTKEGWSKIESSEDTFKFYNDMNAPGWNMRDKAKEYLAWCKDKGFRPKFDWGINSDYYRAYCEEQGYEPNQQIIDIMDADTTDGVWNQYYKFLTDFTAYKPVFNEQGEMIDEIPSPQLPVQSNFDFSEMERDVLFEGEKSMLGHREENIKKAERHMDALAAQVVPYLNGEITEEEMGLKDNVFYKSSTDAENYLEEIEKQMRASKAVPEWFKNIRRSQELDQNNSPFILAPDGGIDFGEILPIHHLPAAPIRLSEGDAENGYIHINNRHGKEIQKQGFNSIEEFVKFVVDNFTRIQEGSAYENETGGQNQTYLVQLQDKHNNTLFIQLSRDGQYWNVNSAGVFKKNYGNNKKNIWSASEVQSDNSAVVDNGLQSEPNADTGSTSNGTPSDASKGKDSENIENPSDNTRLSVITPEMDADYLAAVERGDMETAQRMVLEAAKLAMPNTKVVDENGNPKVVYHQTNAKVYVNRETGQNWDELNWKEKMEWDERDDWEDYWEEQDFNTFSRVNARTTNEFDGFFFAPEYDEYHEYGERTIAAFVNIQNPASREDYNIDSRYSDAGRAERIRLQEAGFDGVIRMDGEEVDEYIAFEPNQIKSAEPVTYDDAGNVIPLSERFNSENKDIRFSVIEPHQSSMDEIDEMFREYNADQDLAALYDKVSALARTMGLQIRFAESWGKPAGSAFIDKVKYNVDFFNDLTVYPEQKAQALLHELIHTMTSYAIFAKNQDFLNPQMKEAVAELENIYNELKDDADFAGMRAVMNVHEMVAELANTQFRAKLREKNLLQRVLDAIKKLLGIEVGENALDNLSATFDYMMENFDGEAFGIMAETAGRREDYIRFSAVSITPEVREEMDTIKAKAMWDGTFMKTPNGADTKLTEDQWLLVRTKNFLDWFGDWISDPENASKVVDENGEPMVVYHGTGKEYGFTIFNTNPDNQNLGSHFGTAEAARVFDSKGNHTYEVFLNIRNPWSSSVEDFWTDDEETYAFVIAELANHLASQGNEEAAEIYNKTVAQYPMAKDSETWLKWFETGEGRTYKYMSNQHISLRRLLEIGGYDGWKYENFVEDAGSISWVALSPSQIKSATDNTGLFSESDDIRYSSRFDVNTNPTEAQKKAGNYKMGHLRLDGYNITIENPKGSVRRGTDSKGNEWENTLNNDYGYIRGTEGVDGDHIDVYLSDNPEEGNVFVVDQVNPETREFDEHKVMYGFNSMDEARKAYLANFSEGWNGLGTITEVTKDEFRKWIDSSHRKTKPFSEYKSVKAEGAQSEGYEEEDITYSVPSTPTDEIVAEGMKFSIQDFARLAGNIFQDMPESFRKEAIEETFKRGWDMQSAIFQIPARLAEKENWDEADKDLAKVIREKVQDAIDESGVVMSRPLTTKEALWMLYRSTEANGDSIMDAAKRSIVAHNLGFDSRSMALKEKADDYIRYSVVRNRQIDAATDMYNYEANLWTSRLAESWLDMNQSVIALQDALADASGKPIASWENVVLALNQLSSKSYAEKKKYLRDFLMPLWEQIIEMTKVSGLSIEQIERYMMLKHGLERNKKFAMRDAKQFYREMYDKVADRMKNTSHAEQVVALSEANKRIADIDAQIATASGKKLKDLQEARERAVVEKEIAELVLRNDEQQNEADLQMYFNAIEAENNPKYAEFREKDYGGLTSMFMDQIADVKRSDYKTDEAYQAALLASVKPRFDKVADMEAEAQKEVDDYEGKAYMPALWKLVNAATKETLRHQHAAGVITTEQYDVVRNMFDYYVPLRGFADNTAEDMYSYYMNNSAGGFAKPIIAAKGRKTRAESPLGWIGTMAESAIQQDNKNEVKMKLYYALMNRPDTGVLSLSEMWYVYDHTDPNTGRKVFVPAYPPATGGVLTADQMRQHMDAWEASMKAKQAIGEAYKREQGVNLGGSVIFQDKAQDAEHIIRVKVAGKDYAILVNGNPRAAQAINGLLNPDANVGPVRQWYGALRRGMSALMTSFSPLFWVANYQRDLLSSFMRTSLNEGWGQAFKYLGNRFHGWKAAKYIYTYDNGTIGDSYYENLYKEFAENGGITGYTSLTTNKEYEKLLADYAKNVDKEMLNWIKGVWDKFMGFGEAIEQVSRFAAYITARESGKSIEEAVAAAKEVSVNFNRKGSTKPISLDELEKLRDKNGNELSAPKKFMAIAFSAMPWALKELYFFFNASIQALSSSAKLARKSPGKAMAWAGMYMGLSVGLAFLNYLLAGDDDDNDYLDLPDYLRHSTALFKMGDNYYFKWSLPQEMRPFYATADILVSKIMGKTPQKTAWNTVGDIALAAAEWLPVNPFGTEDPLLALVPDVAAPFMELRANQNSFGGKIYNDMPFVSEDVAKEIPAYRKGTSKTGEIYVDMAEFLNDITGGDEVQKGIINLNPAKVEHLVEGYGGGIYDFGKMVIGIPGLIYDAVWGERVEVRDIPFVNKILLSTDETNMNSHVNEAFYHYRGISENAERVENEYRQSDDPSRADDYRKEDDWRIHMLFRQYEEDLKMADKKVKKAVDDTEKDLALQEQNIIREMLLNDIASGKSPDLITEVRESIKALKKEVSDDMKPVRNADKKRLERKRAGDPDGMLEAILLKDSLMKEPRYQRAEAMKNLIKEIEDDMDAIGAAGNASQRDSLLGELQEKYEALMQKAAEEIE